MTFEPHKFFIGLVDFFSILMPGALLTYLGKDWASTTLPNLFCFDSEGVEGLAVFFFSSYILGHFLFLIGSLLDDLVYEPVRNATAPKQGARLLLGRKLSAKPLRWFARVCFKTQPDRAVDRVVALKTDCLSKIGNAEVVNAFQWCKANEEKVVLKNAAEFFCIHMTEAILALAVRSLLKQYAAFNATQVLVKTKLIDKHPHRRIIAR